MFYGEQRNVEEGRTGHSRLDLGKGTTTWMNRWRFNDSCLSFSYQSNFLSRKLKSNMV